MDQALNQKIDAYIAENKEQLLQDIAALVAIDSVEGTPEEGAPFGAGPRAALDKTLELAAGMGLATRNCENYIGYAELAGADPEKYLATICHVDVVPVGNGWSQDPFKMQIRDGWMIGRGVADDKGPMVATLYALKFLKEEGVSLRYPIRAMVGDNEETHMNDVEYYLKNYPAPVFCFTPDAEFPVCNGEKGHFGAELVSPVCNGEIKEFEGGVANNAVPDRASALVETDITKLKNAPNITLEPEGNGVRIRGWGKSGHAAMPEGTVNAIGLVVNYLLDNGLCNETERTYLEAVRKLHASTAGEGLGINCADEAEADRTVRTLCALFGFTYQMGNSSIVAMPAVECTKQPYLGTHGHIAIGVNSVDRAVYHLGLQGAAFDEATRKTDAKGRTKAIYLQGEFGGFAIHLVKK